ncbi:MAG: hypothetical protein COA32_11175 [Fluviicola sp.]|nr:MAG: hypothetical protein COA32_11175 [Fluviicola sp.]
MDYSENPNFYLQERSYKSKYICTYCRKTFKRKVLSDINKLQTEEKAPKCPECGRFSSWIGPKFRSPKKDDLKAWKSVDVLYDLGLLHYIGWTNSDADIPNSRKGLKDFLIQLKEDYERNVRGWVSAEYSIENKNQIKYFSDGIRNLERAIQKI